MSKSVTLVIIAKVKDRFTSLEVKVPKEGCERSKASVKRHASSRSRYLKDKF